MRDVDGLEEGRKGTISVFEGPEPEIRLFANEADEIAFIGGWIGARCANGMAPHEILVLVRSADELARAKATVTMSGQKAGSLTDRVDESSKLIALGEMHLAKGLEARAVAVMACDDEIIPLRSRIEGTGEEADLDEVFESERHLLYVACTRARDQLAVTGVKPGSEFLSDLLASMLRR